jgi:hypothetical protein
MDAPLDTAAEAAGLIPKRRAGGRQRQNTASSAVDEASRKTIQDIVDRLRSQARALRRLGYGFLLLIALTLAGGAYFYWFAQTFVLDQMRDRSEQAKAIAEEITKNENIIADQEKEISVQQARLSEVSWSSPAKRSNALHSVRFSADGQRGWVVGENGTILSTTDGGASWKPQTSGTSNTLFGVQFSADGQRGWVVGQNGTIQTGHVPNGRDIDDTISKEKNNISGAQQEITRLQKERARIDPSQGEHPWMESVFVQVQASRIGVILVILFFVNILLNIYRYSFRLAGHYDARADALALAQTPLGPRFEQLARAMSPDTVDFGRAPRNPAEQLLDVAREAVSSRAKGRAAPD